MDPQIDWLKYVAYTLLASIGGALGFIMRTIDARLTINWWMVLLNGVAAGFVGFITLLICMASNLSPLWTGVIVGILGWMGANASMGLLSKIAFNKLGLNPEPKRERAEDEPH